MSLNDQQKQQAQQLFSKGYSTDEVFRHLGAKSIGKQSGVDAEEATIKSVESDNAPSPKRRTLVEKTNSVLGLDKATQTFGDAMIRTRLGSRLLTPENASEANAISGVSDLEVNRENIAQPTRAQLGGAALQAGATIASPLIAPVSLPAQIAAGAALGYAYDVGDDLVEQKTTAEVLTPGLATGIGAVAPPVLKGLGRLFQRPATDGVERLGAGFDIPQGAAQGAAPTQPTGAVPELGAPTAQSTPQTPVGGGNIVGQTVEDIFDRVSRTGERLGNSVRDQATRADRLASAPPNVREAIKTEVDDVTIDLFTNGSPQTQAAMREMLEIAETPATARPGVRPTKVSEDAAVQQYSLIDQQRRTVGQQIGELSDSLGRDSVIDMNPAQRAMRDVLRQNDITAMTGGELRFGNKSITPEQQTVVKKLYDLATQDTNLSPKQVHQMDQLFSRLQRQSRVIDKVDDIFVKVQVADGETRTVNLFKVFRDIYGKQLDNVAPEMRELNSQYRKLSNFTEDLEGSLVKDSRFQSLAGQEGTQLAEAGLRKMFGESQFAKDYANLYNSMDELSRTLGYEGARADELYYFGNKLRDYYPDTIPETGLRANIGASIQDVIGNVLGAGKANVDDQQRALRQMFGMEDVPTKGAGFDIPMGMSIKAEGIPKGTTDADLIIMRDYTDMVNGSLKGSADDIAKVKSDMQDVADKLNLQNKASGDVALSNEAAKILDDAKFSETLPSFGKSATTQTTSAKEAVAKGLTEDEFVKGQGKQLFHGTNVDFETFKASNSGQLGKGVYFYDTADKASEIAPKGKVVEAYVPGKFATMEQFRKTRDRLNDNNSYTNVKTIEDLERQGFVGIDDRVNEISIYNVFDPKNIKTSPQLRAEYQAAKANQ